MSFLDDLLSGVKSVAYAGAKLLVRPTLNFQGAGVSLADNPITGATDITIAGGGSGGGQSSTSVANGLNSNVPTTGLTSLRLTGPTGAFLIGGFAPAAAAGVVLSVLNTTSQPMTLVHEDASSTAANRIDCQSNGNNVIVPPVPRAVTFIYDGTTSRWVLQNAGLYAPRSVAAKDFGAKGDGSTDDHGAIASAVSAVSTAGGTVYLHSTAAGYRLGSNLSIPANVSVQPEVGATLNPDTGTTLTILGPVLAHRNQHCFAGAGLVQLPNESEVSAIWFGADNTGVADCSAAFLAAMLALNTPPVSSTSGYNAWQGQTLICPPGTYYFTSTLEVIRPMTIKGFGSVWPAYAGTIPLGNTVFKFEQGVDGVRIPWILQYENTQLPNNGHRGTYSKLQDIFIAAGGGGRLTNATGTFNPNAPYARWAPGITPTLHKMYIPSYDVPFGYAYEATTVAGATGSTEPTWRHVAWPPLLASAWASTTFPASNTVAGDLYLSGQSLVSTTVWLQPSTPDGHVYALTTAGNNTGFAEPTFNSSPGATTTWGTQVWTEMGLRDTIVDGGVTWTLRKCYGIDANDVVIVERCQVAGFAGDAFHSDNSSNGGGNGQQVLGSILAYCGGSGIFVEGGNSNASIFERNNIITCQNWGIYDGALLGNYYYGNQQAGCTAGGTAVYGSSMFGNYNEGGSGALIVLAPGGVFFGGNQGGNAGDELSGSVSHPAWTANTVEAIGNFVSDAASGWYFKCTALTPSSDDKTGSTSPFATGTYNGSPFSRAQPIPDNHVTWTPWGRTWLSQGLYAIASSGGTGTQPFDVVNSTGAQVVTTHVGRRGDTNLTAMAFAADDDAGAWFGWNYVPASGRWQFTRDLTNPALAAVTNTHATEGANKWIFPQGYLLGFVTGEGLATNSQPVKVSNPYRPMGRSVPTWTVGDEVTCSLQSDTANSNGPGCTAGWKATQSGHAAPAWVNSASVGTYQTASGSNPNFFVVPSPSQWNGHYYKCTTVGSTTLGAAEPGTGALVGTPWPTGSGATVTDGNGNVFTEQGLAAEFIESGALRIEDLITIDLSEGAPQTNSGAAPIVVTLTAHQCCAKRLKLFSSSLLSDNIKVIIKTPAVSFPNAAHNASFGPGSQVAAAATSFDWLVYWDSTNANGHTVTVAASSGDTGVALTTGGKTQLFWSDGTTMRASGPAT